MGSPGPARGPGLSGQRTTTSTPRATMGIAVTTLAAVVNAVVLAAPSA
jgi:hypothetical protein